MTRSDDTDDMIRGQQTLLRPVDKADVELLIAWHADESVARYWDWETFTRESMLERLARPDVAPYLVLSADDGEPIGYLQAWRDAEGGGGLDMFLEASARGRGLGPDAARAMAEHLVGTCGWKRVTVDPYLWNDRAVRAWRKAGFVERSRHEPDHEHTAAWMLLEFRDRTRMTLVERAR